MHGHLATVAGGVRALLLQASHPGALVGVRAHSRFRDDALGRLAGTTRWLVTLTFGSTALAERESARVRRMHDRVRGTYESPGEPGVRRRYSAADQDLLRWVQFTLLNIVVEDRIAQPQQIDEMYKTLPAGALEAIARRDEQR